MAKQAGKIFVEGTVDDICFYKMDGKFYARKKSSLSKKRVLTDPRFQNTIAHAQLLGKASAIASKFYRTIEKERHSRELYRSIVGKVMKVLREE